MFQSRRPVAPSALRLLAALAVVAGVLPAVGCERQTPATPPNLVLVVVDTLRQENVSFHGYPRPTAPNLDALARDSVVFDQAISVGGNTSTAMAALMLGRQAHYASGESWEAHFGMRRFYADASEFGLPKGVRTLAELLRERGYFNAGIITNYYLKGEFGFDRGFDRYIECFQAEGHGKGLAPQVLEALSGLLDAGLPQPYFLYLHLMDVHHPYWPPEEHRQRFAHPERTAALPGQTAELDALWKRWDRDSSPVQIRRAELRPIMLDLYDASIAYTDQVVADVLQRLERTGRRGNTAIAFTADHGEEFLEHGGTMHKGTLYDEIVRVPMLLHLPDGPKGRVAGLVRNFDVMPTLLELAGVDPTGAALDAVSLLPLLENPGEKTDRLAYASFPNIQMLRSDRLKLLRYRDGRVELYDLTSDPREQRNLVTEGARDDRHRELATRLGQRLDGIDASFAGDRGLVGDPASLDAQTIEQLRSLGYLQ